jgi:hypothetical protein
MTSRIEKKSDNDGSVSETSSGTLSSLNGLSMLNMSPKIEKKNSKYSREPQWSEWSEWDWDIERSCWKRTRRDQLGKGRAPTLDYGEMF